MTVGPEIGGGTVVGVPTGAVFGAPTGAPTGAEKGAATGGEAGAPTARSSVLSDCAPANSTAAQKIWPDGGRILDNLPLKFYEPVDPGPPRGGRTAKE